MSSALGPRLARFRTELKDNPRLRWGGLAIVVILCVYLLLMLSDWRQDLQRQYQQRSNELYKMAALAGQDRWIGRAQEASSMRRALDAEIPVARSVGLAQAEVQDSARAIISAFGSGLNTTTQAPAQVAGHPGLWRVPVVLNGVIQPRLLLEVLRRIEGNPKLVAIEQYSYVLQQDRPTVSITLAAYYRIGERKGAGDASR